MSGFREARRIACLSLAAVAALTLTATDTTVVSPYGVCAHLDNPGTSRGANTCWTRSAESAQTMYAAGVRFVRTDLSWGACETAQGVWDYTRTDKAINTCVQNGLEPVPILAYSVSWASPAHEHPEQWCAYVSNVVNRYKGHVRVWEVWNEENSGFWKPTPDAHVYGRFLKLTYETVKSVDSTAKVAMGGTTGVDLTFIGTVQQDGMNAYYDILCVHPYFDPYDPERRLDAWLRKLRTQMDAAGDAGKPIWITEMGMPTAPNPSARNTGNIAAALAAVGRSETPLRVLYWHGGRDGTTVRDDDPFLYMYKRDFPAGSTFVPVGLESFPAALAQGGYDAIVMGAAERYPGKAQHQIAAFVRNGGLLVCIGGAALWYPVRVEEDGNVHIDACEQYNSWWLRNEVLRFEVDAWFLNDKIPQRANDDYPSLPTEALWPYRPNQQSCARFFRANKLKEGDEWMPLLQSDMGNGYVADGVVAITYGSDMSGAVILSGVSEPQGCRVCSPERQAWVLARAYMIALASGVERASWYEFVAHEYDDSDSEEHFGIVHRDLTPKPAYTALQTLATWRPAGSTDYGDLNEHGKGVYSPRWHLPDGRSAGALWSVDAPGTYYVKFRTSGATVEFADVFGNACPQTLRNGVVALTLGESPLYYRGAEVEHVTASACAGASYVWTGAAGNNLYADAGNWRVTGEAGVGGPSWTESGIVDTDAIGGDVTIVMNTDDCHPDVFKTVGSHKVTFAADANGHAFQPRGLYLHAADNVFDVDVSLRAVSGGKRKWEILSSATFNGEVAIPDDTTIDNRNDTDGTCLGISPNAIHFRGKVQVASGKALGLRRAPHTSAAAVHFHGPLICDDLRFGLGWAPGYAYFHSAENRIGRVRWAYSNFVCCNDDVYPKDNVLTWPSSLVNPATGVDELYWSNDGNNVTYTAFNLNGFSQTVAKVAYESSWRRPWISSGSPATLTLNGSGEAVATVIVGGKVSLVVDSPDLVQEFRNSQSGTAGSIEVRRGTLRLSEATSFVNVRELVIGEGATFDLSTTLTGAMGGLTNVTVGAGGTLKVGSGVVSPFGSILTVRLAAGAFIETDSDITVGNGLWVDGRLALNDTYSDAPWLKGRGRVTVSAPIVATTYVWTGLGGDSRISNANNWEGGNLPTFTSPLSTFVIPVVGSDASPASLVVDTPMTCKTLSFCSANAGRVVMSAEGNGKLTIVKGEVNATNTTGKAVNARLDLPVEFEGEMTVHVGSGDKKSNSYAVSFLDALNSIGTAGISKYGYGVMVIEGSANVIQGNIHNYQGVCRVQGANPVGGGASYAICNYPNAGDGDTLLVLENATVNRNVVTRNPKDQCGPTIRMNGKVTVNGSIGNNAGGTTDSGHMRIHLGSSGVSSEAVVNGNVIAHNNGWFILTGSSGFLRCNGLLDCVRVYCDAASSTILDIGRQARGLVGSQYAWYMKIPLRISADNSIYRDKQGDQNYECRSSTAGIDLNGHKLTLYNFGCNAETFAAGGCYLKGGEGSKLTLTGDANDANGVHILEAASLVRAGTGTTVIADTCTSTGTLDVTGGTVSIVAGGRWENCSRVTISGGKVKVAKGRGFGRSTVLSIGENGTLELDEGVSAQVGELWLNGVKKRHGVWGSLESGAERTSALLSGKGTLTVERHGMVILVR